MSDHKRIVREFLTDCGELLDRLDHDLAAFEKDPANQDCLERIIESVETIRLHCGRLRLRKLLAVSDAGGRLLQNLHAGLVPINSTITTALLAMIDAMRQLTGEISHSGREGTGDFTGLIDILVKLQEPPASGASQRGVQAESARHKRSAQRFRLPKTEADTESQPSIDLSGMVTPSSRLLEVPTPHIESTRHRPLFGRLGGSLVRRGHIRNEDLILALRQQDAGDRRRVGEILVGLGLLPEDSLDAVLRDRCERLPGQARDSILSLPSLRIEPEALERLAAIGEELAALRHRLTEWETHHEDPEARGIGHALHRSVSSLRQIIAQVRPGSLDDAIASLQEYVRKTAAASGKKATLQAESPHVDLDHAVCHVLQESLAATLHGIIDRSVDTPELRAAAGKPEEATIALRISLESVHCSLEISAEGCSDFGDLSSIRNSLSTVGGNLRVEKKSGTGVLVITLPQPASWVTALLVECVGDFFAISKAEVREAVRLDAEHAAAAIEMVRGSPYLWRRDNAVPLIDLRRVLRCASHVRMKQPTNIVLLQAHERTFGLIVDRIDALQDLVVERHVSRRDGHEFFAGSATLADGSVALLLDVERLAVDGGALPNPSTVVPPPASVETQVVFLIEGADRCRLALPIGAADRLEELPRGMIQLADGDEVILRDGEIVPLMNLSNLLELPRAKETATVQIVFRSRKGQPVGVALDVIAQKCQSKCAVQRPGKTPGILGSAVVQDRLADVIDLEALLEKPRTPPTVAFAR